MARPNGRSCHKRCRPGRRLPSSHAPRRGRRPSGRAAHTPVVARQRPPHRRPLRLLRRSSSSARARPRRRSTPRSPPTSAGSSASSRRPPRRRLGLDRLTLTAEQGRREARARISLIAQSEAAALGVALRAHHAARPAQPLGLVLDDRHPQLQLAARPRTARRARLRRRARGLPSRRDEPRPRRSGRSSRSGAPRTPSRRRGSTSTAGRSSPTGRRNRSLRKLWRVERWATFDCYGTLIDWDGGVRAELERIFGDEHADELLERYHEVEPELQRDGNRSYREVLTESMRRLGAPRRRGARARRVAPVLARVPRGARCARPSLRQRGWKLGVLSNTDTTTSPPRTCRSASRSTRSSSRRRSARTSRRTGTGRSSSRAPGRRAKGTCTSRRRSIHDVVPCQRARPALRLDQPARRGCGRAHADRDADRPLLAARGAR